MQICTSPLTDNQASATTEFLQAGCPSCRPTNSIEALKAKLYQVQRYKIQKNEKLYNYRPNTATWAEPG